MARLRVFFLGTSSASPTKKRSLPSVAVQRDGEVIVMDCGEGMQRNFVSMGLGLNKKTTILITHLHGDHVTGILGLLQTMSMAQRTEPLTVVAPSQLKEWLDVTFRTLNVKLSFDLFFKDAREGTIISNKEYVIKAARAEHSIESYSYLIQERDRPGVFNPEAAISLGVPRGRLWSLLQRGRKVSVNGRVILPEQVVGEKRRGRKVSYSGDTRPARRLVSFFRESDLLIFDSTFSEKDRQRALERMHSTAMEAAELAARARVKKLILTHFSARYKKVSQLLREARSVFKETYAAYDGMVIDVPYPQ